MTCAVASGVASCAGDRAETSTSVTAAVVPEVAASADGVLDAGPGIGCPDPSSYFIDVTSADAGTTTFRSSCANATGDFGAVGAVGGPFWRSMGPTSPAVLLEACSGRGSDAAKISIVIGDESSAGSIYYRDTMGNVFLGFKTSMDRSALRIGALGAAIEGSYVATLFATNPSGKVETVLSGSFHVCHLQDVNLTPVK